MKIETFTDIEAWKKARLLVSEIYTICRSQSIKYDYGYRDQIQRAAVSIMSNIAEGFDSGSPSSFILFLNYSYRSASEVQSLLYVALDVKYIDELTFNKLMSQASLTKKLIGGFIRYLKSTKTK
jgi:four helix bundle protein